MKNQLVRILFTSILVLNCTLITTAQRNTVNNKFKQLDYELPTANVYRTASGAPGHEYYQQQADYDMQIRLDDKQQKLYGEETITYHNNSPDELSYLWLQLDQNMRARDSDTKKISTDDFTENVSPYELKRLLNEFDGGFKIEKVTDINGKPLPYTINKTMMRIDLPAALKSGSKVQFKIKWWYNINNRDEIGGRSGYEYFETDSQYLYTIAQFFPRMAVYNDVEGWQNKQFLGRGEFALVFGNYRVAITVPANHTIAATGVLQNPEAVLTAAERNRLKQAASSNKPVMIITSDEADEKVKSTTKQEKTWIYKADNVRDFAFASSAKFIWDAAGIKFENRTVLAMSYYPKEGNPLWEKYSTEAVLQTLETYSKHTFDYPYPVAISVHTKNIGMEYPMICFNGGRPEADGTYSEATKYGMISVIIHEVGHNYFPMIINSDERQWTWMDEGLNTFLQYLTEKEWDRAYPSRRGPAYKIVDYMKGDKSMISPIMTNSESILQFGNNAYGKPATALNILRETIMGDSLFDFAFKTYANRWMFKHPTPADFFRTMEDASGVDLDWFWRGWFYGVDHVDIAITQVKQLYLNHPEKTENQVPFIGDERNKKRIPKSRIEKDTSLIDFYNTYNKAALDIERFDAKKRSPVYNESEVMLKDLKLYQLEFENKGGLPMPVILRFEFSDLTDSLIYIPAEIWKFDDLKVTKVFAFSKAVQRVTLDPFFETADVDRSNNNYPQQIDSNSFELYERNYRSSSMNYMRYVREKKKP